MVNATDALASLFMKFILKACELGISNLYALFRYRLSHFQPYKQGKWSLSMEFFILLHL